MLGFQSLSVLFAKQGFYFYGLLMAQDLWTSCSNQYKTERRSFVSLLSFPGSITSLCTDLIGQNSVMRLTPAYKKIRKAFCIW